MKTISMVHARAISYGLELERVQTSTGLDLKQVQVSSSSSQKTLPEESLKASQVSARTRELSS
jgi:hypothetical protein